ncbi:Nif3-like dinuclear metal center hexameric protein [Lutispora thermophila]|uniref:GTP cyclohydrolase 1 type 2 homolog n=1 Tax=Lutispora thermophila DSM 19022 TaxID=1122184 RepID=A0A1M6EV82_9FIRM|nr:Nif3-like dinuclear metal center hexameric protein [Lutispora thermophila]SHI89333.1 dinuclear metal center protein, YbgI/SA1388 family [Lutispora thermophila DSM 19022]
MAQLKCGTIASIMEKIAPKKFAENWDNVGLIIGDGARIINKIMVCLDLPLWVVDEAIEKGVDMVVTHHPIIFDPLKKITSDTPLGRKIIQLIKNDISVYSSHTNFDFAQGGLNDIFAKQLGFEKTEVIKTTFEEQLYKIVVYIPEGYEDKVLEEMSKAGAGCIGNYSYCSFRVKGMGTFKPLEGTNPFIGQKGKLEKVDEYRVETIVSEAMLKPVVKAMLKAHPYEEVAYDIFELKNQGKSVGLGRIGQLENKVTLASYADFIKKALDVENVRFSGPPDAAIRSVAMLNGSGNSFISAAKFAGADVLITGDMQYHQIIDALEEGIYVIDAGHFGTEKIMIKAVSDYLRTTLTNEGYMVDIIESKSNIDVTMHI